MKAFMKRQKKEVVVLKRKTVFLATGVLFLVLSLALPAFAQAPFPDLKGHWAQDSCYLMESLTVFNGYPDGRFGPDDKITRAQFVKAASLAFDFGPAPTDLKLPFSDVKPTDWFYDAVARAFNEGVLEGFKDKLEPDKPITRGEMARIIALTVDGNCFIDNVSKGGPFKDIDYKKNPLADYVVTVDLYGIVHGYPNGNFGINDTVTRAQAATVLERAIKAEQQPDVLPSDEELKSAVQAFEQHMLDLQAANALDRVDQDLSDYAMPRVRDYYKRVIAGVPEKDRIPGTFAKIEPGMDIQIVNKACTLAETKVHYQILMGITDLLTGKEYPVGKRDMKQDLILKLSDGKWKVGWLEEELTRIEIK